MSSLVGNSSPWFRSAVLYQIYPRSFKDSNGDGIGDLGGIRGQLDYLNDGQGGGLGVDCIWISPFYPSPMKDFGYDVTDYCDVSPVFGSMKDFDELLADAHARGIRVVIDLVVNHTSDQHEWFRNSRQSRNNKYADWYMWHDAKPDGSPPNNWLSMFGGSAWAWNEERRQYYLHSFLKEQPDLNWENPQVQQAVTDVMHFWLKKGVDGFRVDAVDFLGKGPSFVDELANPAYTGSQDPYLALIHSKTRDVGNLFGYLRKMADVTDEYEGRVLIFESDPLERHKPEYYWQFYREINRPFCLPFNFELIFTEWSASEIQKFLDDFQAGLGTKNVPVYVLGNHDQPRFASRVGSEATRAGALLLLTLPGIGLIYNGEEIGMSNGDIPADQQNDPHARDACRTPMQWSPEMNAGFSSTRPWLSVSRDFEKTNVSRQLNDDTSLLTLYRTLIGMRKTLAALKDGAYEPAHHHEDVVSFTRVTAKQSLLILVSFSEAAIKIELDVRYRLVLSTVPGKGSFDGSMYPHEGMILEVMN